jgi:hypothetical protein
MPKTRLPKASYGRWLRRITMVILSQTGPEILPRQRKTDMRNYGTKK